MGMIEDLKDQLFNAQKKVKKLKENKKGNEEKRSQGETAEADVKSLRKKVSSGLESLEGNLQSRTADIPGNFGKYYREKMNGAIKQSGIRGMDGELGGVLSSIVSKILDLDDIIEDLIKKIAEENAVIQYIKKKLEDLGEFVEDIFT